MDPAPTETYPLPLHAALPISDIETAAQPLSPPCSADPVEPLVEHDIAQRAYCYWEARGRPFGTPLDRKSTRLNSSHANISYAVFCLKKKTKFHMHTPITTSDH